MQAFACFRMSGGRLAAAAAAGSFALLVACNGPIKVTNERAEHVEQTGPDGALIQTVRLRDSLRHFVQQESQSSCTAAAVLMVRKLRGQGAIESQSEMIRKHQRSLEDLVPGDEITARSVRAAIEDTPGLHKALRPDDALFGWELYDALVPGHLDAMRDRGFLLLSPLVMGIPLIDDSVRKAMGTPSARDIAEAIAEDGEPYVAALTTLGLDEFDRHAYVVVGVSFDEGWDDVLWIWLLNPSHRREDASVVRVSALEFNTRARTIVSVPDVERDQEFELEWLDKMLREGELCRGFHVRNVLDRNLLSKVLEVFGVPDHLKPLKSVCHEEG